MGWNTWFYGAKFGKRKKIWEFYRKRKIVFSMIKKISNSTKPIFTNTEFFSSLLLTAIIFWIIIKNEKMFLVYQNF